MRIACVDTVGRCKGLQSSRIAAACIVLVSALIESHHLPAPATGADHRPPWLVAAAHRKSEPPVPQHPAGASSVAPRLTDTGPPLYPSNLVAVPPRWLAAG